MSSRLKYLQRVPPSDPTQLPNWLREEMKMLARALTEPATSEAASFNDIKSVVNTTDKYEGLEYWDKTTKRPVYATGTGASAVWHYADGTVAYSPK